jgi:hypothetical protein
MAAGSRLSRRRVAIGSAARSRTPLVECSIVCQVLKIERALLRVELRDHVEDVQADPGLQCVRVSPETGTRIPPTAATASER